MKDLAYLNKYLKKYKYHLLFGTVFIILSNFFAVIPAQIVRYSFNLVKSNIDLYTSFEGVDFQDMAYRYFSISILICGAVIVGLALLRGAFLFLTRQTVIVMSRHIEYDLKNEIFDHYQSLPLSFYRRNNTGDLMARISEDVSKVRMYLGPGIMYGINLITLFLIVIPYMFSVNVKLTLYSLIPLPLLSISIYYVNSIINKKSEEIQESLSRLSTFVQEAFSGIRVLKSFVREKDSLRRFDVESEMYRHKSINLAFVNALFFPLIMGLIGLSVILVVFIGGTEVIRGSISTGNIAEFILYVNLLTWPVASLGWITSIIQRAAASQRRINEFLHTHTDIPKGHLKDHEIQGDIRFENVSFTYPDSGITALKNINFKIKSGETLAIIGSTGSGKTSIADTLCRLFDVSEGAIFVDDINIKEFDTSNYRSQIGYVPQDVFLFSDSIFNNITFGYPDADLEQVEQAAKDADVHHNIVDFPRGYGTRLGERGITLSGGQKQRLSIARAIIKNPKLLILDDCLSAVDTKTENTILGNLSRIMQSNTSVVISHRVSSAKLADHILVLDDGKIIEEGTHDSLLELRGAYWELNEKQLAGKEVEDEGAL